MRVAPEGHVFIAIAGFAAGAMLMRASSHPSAAGWALAAALVLLTAWVVWFFRDPLRTGERGAEVVISPADGRIVGIATIDEPTVLGGPAVRISIFMSLMSVHVNRYPVSGTIMYAHYHPGRFLSAAKDKASLVNEQMTLGIASGDGRRILVRQIAGLVARRIVTDGRVGDVVVQGERLGMIRFGSRVDLCLPPEATVAVALGDLVHAGATVIARLPAGGDAT